LNETLERFCAEDRKRFYLDDFVIEAEVPMHIAEDFFLPLLKEGKLEGKLEVRCPSCGKDIEIYDRLSQIPEEIECEICSFTFLKSTECIQVILEVKDEFFRDQKCSSHFDRKDPHETRVASVIE